MEKSISAYANDMLDALIVESKYPMNSLGIKILFSYAVTLIDINWNDISFGVKNGFFSDEAVIEFSVDQLSRGTKHTNEMIELACLTPPEISENQQIILHLANQLPDREREETKDKFLYLVLAWLFDNRASFVDPLRAVEIIYDDFGFPRTIEGFVRYMPNKDRHCDLFHEWNEYLCSQKKRFWKTQGT